MEVIVDCLYFTCSDVYHCKLSLDVQPEKEKESALLKNSYSADNCETFSFLLDRLVSLILKAILFRRFHF